MFGFLKRLIYKPIMCYFDKNYQCNNGCKYYNFYKIGKKNVIECHAPTNTVKIQTL